MRLSCKFFAAGTANELILVVQMQIVLRNCA
jgi:hypothetical protein